MVAMRPRSDRPQPAPNARANGPPTAAHAAAHRALMCVPHEGAPKCVLQPVRARVPAPRAARGDRTRAAVELGGQHQRALLALLAPRRGPASSRPTRSSTALGRGAAADGADVAPERRLAAAQAARAGRLVTRPPGYVLDVDRDQIDLGRFERLVARGTQLARGPSAQAAGEALALWRGPPLADFAYEPFARPRSRGSRSSGVALEERIDADLELGRHDQLVGELEALVARAPAARAPARAADARALPVRPPGRGARGLPRAARRSSRARHRAGPELQRLHAAILRQEAGSSRR